MTVSVETTAITQSTGLHAIENPTDDEPSLRGMTIGSAYLATCYAVVTRILPERREAGFLRTMISTSP